MASAQPDHIDGEGQSSPAESSTPPSSSRSAALPQRQSSVRFSNDTNTVSRSPMSSRRRLDSSDEITPIKNAVGNAGRSYNTSDSGTQEPSGTLTTPKSKSTTADQTQEQPEPKPSLYKRLAEKYGSVSLENKGSVARDHLALERTFLAWLRTSLAFASIGIAITQLFRLNTTIQSRSKAEQYSIPVATVEGQHSKLPLSPLIGYSFPVELLPYLQQAASSAASAVPTLGPTLLDQLLLLPPSSESGYPQSAVSGVVSPTAFDEHAATRLRHVGKPLGATFLGISILILFIGFHRYFESQHWIIQGKFPASRGSIFLVAFVAGALVIASLVVVLVIAPTTYEKK